MDEYWDDLEKGGIYSAFLDGVISLESTFPFRRFAHLHGVRG